MRSRHSQSAFLASTSVVLAAVWLGAVIIPSCSNHNATERQAAAGPDPVPMRCACVNGKLQPECAPVAEEQCVDNCFPDPGSQCLGEKDCQDAEAGLEFYPLPIWDFDGKAGWGLDANEHPKASNLYNYTDKTTRFFSVNVNFEPDTADDPWDRCHKSQKGLAENKKYRVLHIQGGPFLDWGGGIGRGLKCLNRSGRLPDPNDPDEVKEADKNAHGLVADKESPLQQRPKLSLSSDPSWVDDITPSCGMIDVGACSPEQTDPLAKTACPKRDQDFASGKVKREDLKDSFLLGATLDLSEWEGISFWARRSPNSQAGFRIALGDKYTDDDLSYLQYHLRPEQKRYCERYLECGCRNNLPCTRVIKSRSGLAKRGPDDASVSKEYCMDPYKEDFKPCELGVDDTCKDEDGNSLGTCREIVFAEEHKGETGKTIPADIRAVCFDDQLWREWQCGETLCGDIYKAFNREDVQFNLWSEEKHSAYGRSCSHFTFRGGIFGDFCFEPGVDPNPTEGVTQCGDHWMKGVRLSTDWKFFKVPFKDLLQQGWAQESHWLDLTSASVVRFTWDRGWVDFWIDDVRFYRRKKKT